MSGFVKIPMQTDAAHLGFEVREAPVPLRYRAAIHLLNCARRLSSPWVILGYGLSATELDDDRTLMRYFEGLADERENATP